ncbi:MAG: helix-turn-helix domain-containing protein [Deltaproteobacteria bacterium]
MSFKDIGLKIQIAREEKGLSQEQLARALGCSQPALSNYEKGKRRLYLSHLEKLSEVLEKPPEYFMENSDLLRPGPAIDTASNPRFDEIVESIKELDDKDLEEIMTYVKYLKWRTTGRQR